MVGQVVVRDGNGCGFLDDVDEPISTVGERVVVHPDVGRAKDADRIAIARAPQSDVGNRVPDHAPTGRDDVVEVDAVDYDVLHELDGDPRAPGDMDVDAAAVDGLVASHDQLLLQVDDHVAREDDPQRLGLDHRVPESAPAGLVHFVVRGVCHHVDPTIHSSGGPPAEPEDTFGQLLAVQVPVRLAPPAPVNRVRRDASATKSAATEFATG